MWWNKTLTYHLTVHRLESGFSYVISLFIRAHFQQAYVIVFPNWFLSQVTWPSSFPIINCNYNFGGKHTVLMCSEEECHKLGILYFSFLSSRHSGKASEAHGMVCLPALYFRDSINNWYVALTLTSPLHLHLCCNSHLLLPVTECSMDSKVWLSLRLWLKDSSSALLKLS